MYIILRCKVLENYFRSHGIRATYSETLEIFPVSPFIFRRSQIAVIKVSDQRITHSNLFDISSPSKPQSPLLRSTPRAPARASFLLTEVPQSAHSPVRDISQLPWCVSEGADSPFSSHLLSFRRRTSLLRRPEKFYRC